MNPFDAHLQATLRERELQDRYRVRAEISSAQGPLMMINGRQYLAFCSNDYLGLASHPDVSAAMVEASGRFGVGSGASHLVCGHSAEHHALEQELAEFCGRERALVFSTGYMANLGAVTALVGRGDAIVEDKLNHASLIDAGRLSGAHFTRFRHSDLDSLRVQLEAAQGKKTLVAVDGVFSMDGDLAPLAEQATLVQEFGGWMMVDDAHGFGCIGPNGRGTLDQLGVAAEQVPVYMGTLGKALGSFGAFIAGSEALIETLIQLARPYIYTTALPPAVAAATRQSLRLVSSEPWRRQHLQALIRRFRRGAAALGYRLMPSATAIQPLLIGSDSAAMALFKALGEEGVWISAIRPPTVPKGTARLRVTLSASHTEDHVDELLGALSCVRHLLPEDLAE